MPIPKPRKNEKRQNFMDRCMGNATMNSEFPEPGKWPGWSKGVMTMYAGEIVANHMFANNIVLGGLDCMSQSSDLIGTTDYHIHAFQSEGYFSKLKWRKCEYDDIDVDRLQVRKMNDYCLYIATMSIEEVAELACYDI